MLPVLSRRVKVEARSTRKYRHHSRLGQTPLLRQHSICGPRHHPGSQTGKTKVVKPVWRLLLFNHCHIRLFVTPQTAAHQASLSLIISWSLPKLHHVHLCEDNYSKQKFQELLKSPEWRPLMVSFGLLSLSSLGLPGQVLGVHRHHRIGTVCFYDHLHLWSQT